MKQETLPEYGFAAAAVGVCTAVGFTMSPFFEPTNLVMIYLLGVLVVAARGHRGPAAVASVLSVLLFDFCFVQPRFLFSVADMQYLWTFAVMFVAAMTISHLAVRLRREAESARQGQRRTALMHAFTQHLSSTRASQKALQAAVDHVAEVFESAAAAFVPDESGKLRARARSGGAREPSDKELGVAQWVYDRWQSAGLGTPSLPETGALYVPLQCAEGPAGVLRVEPRSREALLAPEQRLLLDSFAHQIALTLEVTRLEENARKSEVEAETERLRSGLLSSVSHDFRTPLAAILGSAGALLQKKEFQDDKSARELLESIQEESERLSRIVHNLLEATRLESGAVQVRKEPVPLEETIGSALERLNKVVRGREVAVEIPDDLPLVPMDAVLIEQVFVNLLENAVRHTAQGSRLRVSARAQEASAVVSVADEGPGLEPEELERVFDKFYKDPSSPGAGLGLSICRAIVGAHGGRIWAERGSGKGTVFRFTLPL